MFQSTPPRRGDENIQELINTLIVSIHAPAKGRRKKKWGCYGIGCFNPRPREGATNAIKRHHFFELFQSTPPRRGDRVRSILDLLMESFNPRPREGATTIKGVFCFYCIVSIHAPAKGRHKIIRVLMALGGFNPRPREGATKQIQKEKLFLTFQSTPPRRGDTYTGL